MLKDLCFYLQNHSQRLSSGLDSPDSVITFAKKIIASHYLQLTQFVRSIISHKQSPLSKNDYMDLRYFDTERVSTQWSDMQALTRRLAEYTEDVEGIMVQCGIPLQPLDNVVVFEAATKPWDDCTADFQFIRHRLGDARRRTDALNDSFTALVGMADNRRALAEQARSLREARSTKALTLLGLVFLPLAYTASLFSMTAPYGPGDEKFWLYFAISVPLILCVVVVYGVVDVALGENKFEFGDIWGVLKLPVNRET